MRDALQEIVDEFAGVPKSMRLAVLLEYADDLLEVPAHIDQSQLERVEECQTPFFSAVEVGPDGRVALHFAAPPEAPTTRGYAGVLQAGLNGATVDEVLQTPADFFVGMQLAELISPLRLRGMGAILARVKRQVVERTAG